MDPQLGADLDQQTIVQLISASVARPRFNMFVLGSFAIVALALAVIGIYGVLSHAVTQRTREIGIRIAVGAAPARVRRAVLRESSTVTGVGAVIGLLGAAAVTRYLESMLFESVRLSHRLSSPWRCCFSSWRCSPPTCLPHGRVVSIRWSRFGTIRSKQERET